MREAGDPSGAAAALNALLTDQRRVLDADHPNTLTFRNNLAYWRGHVTSGPEPLTGVEGLTGRNEARLIGWAIRSRLHGAGGLVLAATAIATATLSAWITRPLSTGMVIATLAVVLVIYPLAVVAFLAAVRLLINDRRRQRGWLVGYFTPDATQLVHPHPAGDGWILSDHFARRRGQHLATAFRQQVFAHIAAEADRHQAIVVIDTHAEKLAHIYARDMAELRVCSASGDSTVAATPTWPRGCQSSFFRAVVTSPGVVQQTDALPFPIEWSGRRWTATCSPASLGRGVVLGLCGR